MKPIYDIRQQIPQFAANFFPQPDPNIKYPKMMTHSEGGKLKPYLDATKKPVIVQSEREEIEFLASKNVSAPAVETAKAVEISVHGAQQAAALTLPQHSAADVEQHKRGPGRPPLPKNLTA